MKKLISVLILVVLLGCAKNPATGGIDFVLMSEDDEFEIGHEHVRKSIKEHGLYKEKDGFVKYYQSIARNLVDVTERSEKPFEFIMLDSGQFNAWATPGYINVYRGIIPFMNSESEFAAVMSHEAGHITARHAVRTNAAATAGTALLVIGAGILGANMDNNEVATVAIGAGLFAVQAGFAKYSRTHEDEADELALRYMEALGYDPREAAGMYKTMGIYKKLHEKIYKYFNGGKTPPNPAFYDLMASHPDPDDRVKQVIKRKGALSKDHVNKTRDVFLKQIDGMAFGPNFRQYGAVGARNVYSPHKRFTFTLPEGFFTTYTGSGWQSYNDIHKAKASMSYKRVAKGEDPEETLRVMYPKLRQLQKLDIDGFEVYTGVQSLIEKNSWSKDKDLGSQRVFGFKAMTRNDDGSLNNSGRDFFSLSFIAPREIFNKLDEQFFLSAESIKRLTRKKANSLQPLRIKIHKIKASDTIGSLSEKMAFGDLKEGWFRALNGMSMQDKLVVGQKVKLIIDPNLSLLN